MKTSVNIPDWLHAETLDAAPGVTFGELCRDALLIALPVWAKSKERSSIEVRLRARLRMADAEALRHRRDEQQAARRVRAANRQPGRPKRAPDARPVGRPGSASKSATKAQNARSHQASGVR